MTDSERPAPSAPESWNFKTYETYINQRFSDMSLRLNERYNAQQTGFMAAFSAYEKAVDKAEGAQQLRNEAQNEFRKSLSDLSGLMWTTKEGTAMVESLRREVGATYATLNSRVNTLESGYANLQGRIWAVSALFAISAMAIQIFSRLIIAH